MMTLGERIGQKRRQTGLTQEQLANKLGVSSQAVSKWENDISCPDISLLPDLARELGCTVDALLRGESTVQVVPEGQRKKLEDMVLRIYVSSSDGDRVKVNLPVPLVKIGLECGMDFIPEGSSTAPLKNLDLAKLMELVEKGVIGKLVEVESADGDTVEIVVE